MKSVTPAGGAPWPNVVGRDGGAHLPVVPVRAGQLAEDLERAGVVGRRSPVEDLPALELHVGGVEGEQRRLRVVGAEDHLRVVLARRRRCCSGARSGPIPTGTDDGIEDVRRRLTGDG